MFKAIQKMKGRENRGFTLVELLIVVAIIGILAAIAIPQFAAYRIRGFNAAATSDLRNIKIAAEAFVTDWQVYASTEATGQEGDGAVLEGPATPIMSVPALSLNALFPSTATTFTFGISNGVSAVVNTTTGTGAAYTAGAAHRQGDVAYASDSGITQIKRNVTATNPKVVGTPLGATASATGIPASTANLDDLPTANWATL